MDMNFRSVALLSFVLGACQSEQKKLEPKPMQLQGEAPTAASNDIDEVKLAAFQPLPEAMESAKNPLTPEKIAVGRQLFFEKRLSKSQEFSCNSCHDLLTYGVDNKKTSEGHKKQFGARNSPTVYNAAGHFVQFWDGRSPDVEDQAQKPLTNPLEMACPDKEFVKRVVVSIPGYVEALSKAFPNEKGAKTIEHVGKVIGAFERKLVTPSRWDKFLKGDKSALTAEEKAGFNAFVDTGCIACHSGTYVGGQSFQKLGAVKPWPSQSDTGRMMETKNEADRMIFKVPSLRNVEKTSPYFHDGSVDSLDQAVKLMATHQLGKELNDDQTKSIVTWLKTLTGELPMEYIAMPTLPPSGKNTPKADLN